MMNNHKSLNTSLLPFPVIRMAADGDVDAINAVLRHYEGYKPPCLPSGFMMKTATLTYMLMRN